MQSQPNPLLGFLPMIFLGIPAAVIANMLAKEKGRNVMLWTIVGLIPIIGLFSLWYFVGASNLRLERKIDELLARQSAAQ
jgi:hypothetical protein